jgi:carbon monoxide dehydrogenase subunit G
VHVEETQVVERPPADVFALLVDLRRAPEWQPSLQELDVETDGETRVGTSGREVRRAGGRRVESRFEVTELEPDRRLAISTSSSAADVDVVFELEPDGAGTRITSTLHVRLKGALRFMERALRGQVEGQTRDDLLRLDELLARG